MALSRGHAFDVNSDTQDDGLSTTPKPGVRSRRALIARHHPSRRPGTRNALLPRPRLPRTRCGG